MYPNLCDLSMGISLFFLNAFCIDSDTRIMCFIYVIVTIHLFRRDCIDFLEVRLSPRCLMLIYKINFSWNRIKSGLFYLLRCSYQSFRVTYLIQSKKKSFPSSSIRSFGAIHYSSR